MEAEFQRALLGIVVVGSAMFGIGATILFFVFRGFGRSGAGKPPHMALMVGLIAFVMLCCFMLFWLAFVVEKR